ncbi:hypothetical protein [Streptomyces lancefieldiae]|uniref:Secreted protein n=1 Tax=Streptomyces lancefieldiae TaxID=3075520 RepID=A0ABU3AXA9_9ACTN|nr:hypothetical protein [Streptomyces sp. DSM 40712]MDT0614826.1 hypothetical protein [Streptomyces sp. DSM 40712]
MRPARRTAPAPAGRRVAVALTALLALLLALVPAWPAAGTHVGPSGLLPVDAATAVPHPAFDHRADDGCTPVCAAQARARHDPLGERPPAPDHHSAAAPHDAGAAPAAHARTPAAPGGVPAVSPGRTSHDRGRAPPASSGT